MGAHVYVGDLIPILQHLQIHRWKHLLPMYVCVMHVVRRPLGIKLRLDREGQTFT